MDNPLFGNIGTGSRRELAKNLFSGFYERGISANDALSELRSMGLGYRRTDFLSDYAQGKGTYDQETKIRFVNPLDTPSERILSEKYHGVPDKYSLVFRYDYYNGETDTSDNGYFFYHRNTLSSRADMENDAYDYLTNNSEKYGFEITSVTIAEGYINPVWS